MITMGIYSYKVRIKYGVYTRTIIREHPSSILSPTCSSLSVQANGKRSHSWGGGYSLVGFPLVQAIAEAEIITQNQF